MNLFLQIITVLQCFFIVCMTVAILAYYSRDARVVHIAMIAVSYCILTILSATRIFTHMTDYPVWRIGLNFFAFAIGDYALIWMFKNGKRLRAS